MIAGKVYLVGAGPGDPGLITLRGLELLGRADVVFYDYLASAELLERARESAEKILVGKQAGEHVVPQARINELMIEKAREGKTVVRLKGGDPFIFGRGGEEAQALAEAGIGFEVVPGVTSAISVPAYAGIPLTHRAITSSVAFVTGHEDPAKTLSDIPWKEIATGPGTVVFLMGVKQLPAIVEKLQECGRHPSTPVAVIHRGTLCDQQTLVSTLDKVVEASRHAEMQPPSVIVVGEVVRLREQLMWFEKRPLLGRYIVVTRACSQASELGRGLTERGACVVEFPTIRIEPPRSYRELDMVLGSLGQYDYVVFTSVNGVKCFLDRLMARDGRDLRALAGRKLVAIGKATSASLLERGLIADIVPADYSTDGLLKEFGKRDMKGKRVLLARVENAPRELPEGLERLGCEVQSVATYRTVEEDVRTELVESLIDGNRIDLVTFTSSSTVGNFVGSLRKCGRERSARGLKAAAIGPVTAAAAREAGFDVVVEPAEHTIASLVDAIVAKCGTGRSGSEEAVQ